MGEEGCLRQVWVEVCSRGLQTLTLQMENSVLLPCYYIFSTTKMNVDVLQPTLIQSFNSFRVQNDTLFKIPGRGDSAYERDGDARRKF